MQKLFKGVIITVVLLIPVLVFLFLKQFGSNKFELPVYYIEGNPITECQAENKQHLVSGTFVDVQGVQLPALFYYQGEVKNEFYFDLVNVLERYPAVNIYPIVTDSAKSKTVQPIYDFDLEVLNCELILGEDHFLLAPLFNKYVLVDSLRQIRGYFMIDELKEIDRLDMELDILLNY